MSDLDSFIDGLPKAELHMHLEGSIEPELMFELAQRNDVSLPWSTPDEVRAAYEFSDLQSFLDLFWAGCRVLERQQDFYDMTMAYLRRARRDNVLHAEVFLGLQNFSLRGIQVGEVMRGIFHAFDDAAGELGMSTGLIVVAQRHRPEAAALELLDQILPWCDRIVGIGLGGPEVDFPPSGFVNFYAAARDHGFRVVVHAGEEGPAAYVRQAVDLLGAERIDHGNACLSNPDLVRLLAERQIPLTVCPLSNLRLKVVPSLEAHPLRELLEFGLNVSLNSDDPSYFGGYVNDNFKATSVALGLTRDEIEQLARNSFRSAFLPPEEKQRYLGLLDAYVGSSAD